jgi:lactoylglutathione lyase
MVRVRDIDESLDFYCTKFGLVEMRRKDVPEGRFTLIFLAAPKDMQSSKSSGAPELELTFNWDPEDYDYGRNFGHLAYKVDNIYEKCQQLMDAGIVINRPPRDGPEWHLSSHPTIFQLNCCKKAIPCHQPNHGFQWKIRDVGRQICRQLKGDEHGFSNTSIPLWRR